ncbi:MAG: 50S ribosomal protein L29 [Candidatus Cloacimonetes bacterium]|nr:50S ribosomal protein L29 [Candidatus Cloacimonadota bacterium]
MKIQELRELTMDELQQKLEDFREEMFNLRFQKSMNRLENTNRIVAVKKSIARINTLMTELKPESK